MRQIIAVVLDGWDALKDMVARRRRPPTARITSVSLAVPDARPPTVTIASVTVA